jgi:hypothetical protein
MFRTFALPCLLASLALASPAVALTVKPVDVTASDTFPFFGQYKAGNLINDSGLTNSLHDANFANMCG